jgi:Fe-S-cluster formation regulator IscX/YfhJ
MKNILAALDDVPSKKYMRLAINLGVRVQDVEKFEGNHSRNSERVLINIVNLWMNSVTDPKPSWQSLKQALSELCITF